jgi:cysteine synthase
MIFDRLREGAGPERRHRVWSKLRILVAAIGTLGSATGIAIAVFGLVQFDNRMVITGVVVIIVSTTVYVSILVRDRNRVD